MATLTLPEIRSLIDKADSLYYRPGLTSPLTDEEYDDLKEQLRALAPGDERLTRVGLPYDPQELDTKVTHTIPMGSLDNTDDGILGYETWIKWLHEKLGLDELEIYASLKIDGASICATYRQGKLVRVATRGNGMVGEDITANAINFAGLPIILPADINIDVRGEAILYKDDFTAICERDKIAESDRSNPRNLGNGIMGRHDGGDSNKIRFMPFNLLGLELETEEAKYQNLRTLGFQPVPRKLCSNISDFMKFYTATAEARDRLPFEIDGIVAILNVVTLQDKFVTSDSKTRLRPKYSRAVKFPHKANTTTLVGVALSVGHTRAIIPTAQLATVRIGGVNVSNALLNNWDEIKRLGIAIGDEVEVVLSGDIIPKIIRRVKEGNPRTPITEPTRCPACGEVTTRMVHGKQGAVTYCSSPECPAAALELINHWIGTSKKGVGILGIGDTMLKALWDNQLIQDQADLYSLTVDQIKDVVLDGKMKIGKSRAEQIVKSINASRTMSLSTFLGSLGIDLLGRRRVKMIMESSNGQLLHLADWLDPQKLSCISGDTISEAIKDGISDNRKLIEKLLANGVTIVDDQLAEQPALKQEASSDRPFAGLSFCLTGTRECLEDIERLGGTIKSSVSKTLSYLVQADPTSMSNKTKKAEEYEIPIISLDYLRSAIAGEVVLSRPIKETANAEVIK